VEPIESKRAKCDCEARSGERAVRIDLSDPTKRAMGSYRPYTLERANWTEETDVHMRAGLCEETNKEKRAALR
jgi:hypothetical protein